MTDFIRPSHAITIWASKEILYVELPHADGSDRQPHYLKLPLNTYGLAQAIEILKARSSSSKVGERGDPTQDQSEKAIAEMQRKAAGYTGSVKKQVKVPLTVELKQNVKEAIRKFINV